MTPAMGEEEAVPLSSSTPPPPPTAPLCQPSERRRNIAGRRHPPPPHPRTNGRRSRVGRALLLMALSASLMLMLAAHLVRQSRLIFELSDLLRSRSDDVRYVERSVLSMAQQQQRPVPPPYQGDADDGATDPADGGDQLSSLCAVPPGHPSSPEGRGAKQASMGYAALHQLWWNKERRGRRKTKATAVQLLCILPCGDEGAGPWTAALETWGDDCDSTVVINATTTATPSALLSDIREGLALRDHGDGGAWWVHVASSPHRYLVADHVRAMIAERRASEGVVENLDLPLALAPLRMGPDLTSRANWGRDETHQRVGCGGIDAAFNVAALREVERWVTERDLSKAQAANGNTTSHWLSEASQHLFAARRIGCLEPPSENLEDLQQYSLIEIPLNDSASPADEGNDNGVEWTPSLIMRRYHAVLRGSCDDIWDAPLGARDEEGRPDYVHNATRLRQKPPRLDLETGSVCGAPLGNGAEWNYGAAGLRKIEVAFEHQHVRVLCMVYTASMSHNTRLPAIAETWAGRCDGYFAASNLTDPAVGAVNLLHEGPEEYANMNLKVKAMWRYVYDHYLDDYDVFYISGDDVYVIPENIRYMVGENVASGKWSIDNEPLFLGAPSAEPPRIRQNRFCGGGAGYTLNRVAVRVLIEELFPIPSCGPHFKSPEEDIVMAKCFRNLGIQCMDTNDAEGEVRYHQLDANFHAKWKFGKPAPWQPKALRFYQGIQEKDHLGQISSTSVSFHVKPIDLDDKGIRRYHAIVHDLCPRLRVAASDGDANVANTTTTTTAAVVPRKVNATAAVAASKRRLWLRRLKRR